MRKYIICNRSQPLYNSHLDCAAYSASSHPAILFHHFPFNEYTYYFGTCIYFDGESEGDRQQISVVLKFIMSWIEIGKRESTEHSE